MPADIELKFRKQKLNESLSDFGFAIQTLGTKAFGDGSMANAQVIDSFCMGIRNPELSAKLLSIQSQFANLSDAIAFAQKKEKTETVKKYIVQNRRGEDILETAAADVSVLQADETVDAVADDRKDRSYHNNTEEPGTSYRTTQRQEQSNGLTASHRYQGNHGRGGKFVNKI